MTQTADVLKGPHASIHCCREVERPPIEHDLSARDASDVKQVVREVGQVPHLPRYKLSRARPAVIGLTGRIENRDAPGDDIERITELV